MTYTAKALDAMSGGDNVAVDRITGSDYQIVKIAVGGEGTATEINATTGLPVSLSTVDNAVLDQIEVNTSYGDNTGGGTEAGALRVTIANDSTGLVSVDDGGATLSIDDGGGSITVDTGTPATGNTELAKAEDVASAAGDVGIMAMTIRDDTLAANAGVNADGDFTYLRVSNFGALWTEKRADTSFTKDTGALAAVKTSAGVIKTINATNKNAAVMYLQVFNLATGSVTLGTTTPTNEFMIPGNTAGSGAVFNLGDGYDYGTAISVAMTTTSGGATTITTGDVVLNIGYQ